MYTKVLEVDGEHRLVFFARTDLKPGQELTYDYRYPSLQKMLCVLYVSAATMLSGCVLALVHRG